MRCMIEKEYFHALNGWRFIFSLLIVVFHMPETWKQVIKHYEFGNTIVLFFFILSGFLLTLGYKDKIVNGEIKYKYFVAKRVATIFPLQWLMTLLFALFGVNLITYWAIPFHLTLTQSLNPFWYINFSLNVPTWFLSSIFICYLLTPLVLKIFAKKRTNFLLFFIIVIALWNIFIFMLPESIGIRWLCYINPSARFIDFSAGILLALYWSEVKDLFKILSFNNILATVLEFLILGTIFFFFANEQIQRFNNYTVLRYPTMMLFIIIFALSSGGLSKILSNKCFQKLGDLAIAIYMCHSFILHFTLMIDANNVALNIVATLILTLTLAYILAHYYCPFTQKLILSLFASKNNNV